MLHNIAVFTAFLSSRGPVVQHKIFLLKTIKYYRPQTFER